MTHATTLPTETVDFLGDAAVCLYRAHSAAIENDMATAYKIRIVLDALDKCRDELVQLRENRERHDKTITAEVQA